MSSIPGNARRRQKVLLVGLTLLVMYMVSPAGYWTGEPMVDDTAGKIIDEKDGNYRFPRMSTSRHKFNSKRLSDCENYADYARVPHFASDGSSTPLGLPNQRPPEDCRTFSSPLIEEFIKEFKGKLKDQDLAILFENTFPNTLDTTILWHVTAEENQRMKNHADQNSYRNEYPETFVVTGDIKAEWLRDSSWQLAVYQPFIKRDPYIKELIRGAINTQSQLFLHNPYCNAFHPPPYSKATPRESAIDDVFPKPNWAQVLECKYEIDSLASFLTLSRQYYQNAPEEDMFDFVTDDWLLAVKRLFQIVDREADSTFFPDGGLHEFMYKFKRQTNIGTETLPLDGSGNPMKSGTGLVRSAFRPSDDACIFQYFVPGNAHLAVELEYLVDILTDYLIYENAGKSKTTNYYNVDIGTLIENSEERARKIREGIENNAVFEHPDFGRVLAYEVDGYGSRVFMDDANIPSLLSLPDIGYISKDNELYQNTRDMILSMKGNPYYMNGVYFKGIGGPHIGLKYAWPMSLLVRIRTSEDDKEIMDCLKLIMENTGGLGLIHESIQTSTAGGTEYTRSWFAWANSEFAKTIFDLADRKPHLIFTQEALEKKFNLNSFIAGIAVS
ncbi:glycoside hydrolase family 125 protein Ecym_3142 [Eremothecium cymbalariae DBVPG|uniref:Glycoside hydrolase family 125 protein n=1 Tax=Eremothecium cymbalariae (strain CBS 270.75 / DBVPG 7215 / KCTC 17166 / NRRL Y-17582) TaxID=931890 RepID=G8JR76_ERECY|nr:Hypothetical protein Ecym_3142 [Eremothecium cymbalariae DBVPG\